MSAQPRLSTAPIRVDDSPAGFRSVSAPRTKRYITEVHDCKQEDTWESLSHRYYRDERCAAALKAFNRNCPWTSTQARRDGVLAPGEQVHIPPLKVLEEEYDSLIRPAQGQPPARPGS